MARRTIAAAVALVVHEQRALVLRRTPTDRGFPHRWCLPGGQLDPGETPTDAVLREALEETGLEIALRAQFGFREITAPRRPLTLRVHRFAAVALSAEVVLSEEHVDYRWLAREEARRAERLLPSGLAGEVTAELLARFARGEL